MGGHACLVARLKLPISMLASEQLHLPRLRPQYSFCFLWSRACNLQTRSRGHLTSTEHRININIARSTQGPQDWADRTAFSIFVVILRRQCWLGFSASIGDYQKFKLESITITLTKMHLQNFDQTSTLNLKFNFKISTRNQIEADVIGAFTNSL